MARLAGCHVDTCYVLMQLCIARETQVGLSSNFRRVVDCTTTLALQAAAQKLRLPGKGTKETLQKRAQEVTANEAGECVHSM